MRMSLLTREAKKAEVVPTNQAPPMLETAEGYWV